MIRDQKQRNEEIIRIRQNIRQAHELAYSLQTLSSSDKDTQKVLAETINLLQCSINNLRAALQPFPDSLQKGQTISSPSPSEFEHPTMPNYRTIHEMIIEYITQGKVFTAYDLSRDHRRPKGYGHATIAEYIREMFSSGRITQLNYGRRLIKRHVVGIDLEIFEYFPTQDS